jgi:transcriptional regulator with XRE-family HTH domain
VARPCRCGITPGQTLGAELRRARRAAGLTQEQLAARAKVDRTNISEIENDKVSPSVDMLVRLSSRSLT